MKHVFVETNWIIGVLRPSPAPAAIALRDRCSSGELRLHVPWVSPLEAKRTLDRIIREDLGFTGNLRRYAVREYLRGQLSASDKDLVEDLAKRADNDSAAAIQDIEARVDALMADVELIKPSEAVITRTLRVYPVKSMKPFDEMVLGAVLTRAEELHGTGERELFFCNANKNDFAPDNRPTLKNEYDRLGLQFLDDFEVPA